MIKWASLCTYTSCLTNDHVSCSHSLISWEKKSKEGRKEGKKKRLGIGCGNKSKEQLKNATSNHITSSCRYWHESLVPEIKGQVTFQPYFLPLWIDLSSLFLSNTGVLRPIFTMLSNLITPLCGSVVQLNTHSYGILISHLVILSLCSGPSGFICGLNLSVKMVSHYSRAPAGISLSSTKPLLKCRMTQGKDYFLSIYC